MQKINGKVQDRKAFTLIELLVVVAIIGILAAVGVVAYNGYTASAKANAVKSNQNLAYKTTSAELLKCELGDEKVLIAIEGYPSYPGFLPCVFNNGQGYSNTHAQTVAIKFFDDFIEFINELICMFSVLKGDPPRY